MGLSGMPRRIYEYPAGVGWTDYNVISSIGSFILGVGILISVVNFARSLRNGAVAGPDPWKGNTLEWFTESPPPPNNFDVVPRVRSVMPMADIRREIERLTEGAREPVQGAPGVAVAGTGPSGGVSSGGAHPPDGS
jgi:cytochrome c oxidase subunit 1